MEKRLIELEIRVAYQERLLADLDEVVQTFTRKVTHLERQLRELSATTVDEGGPRDPTAERPPHY